MPDPAELERLWNLKQAWLKTADGPRPLTVEEMRNKFLEHLHQTARYWAGCDGSNVDTSKGVLYCVEGAMFSVLATLDGADMDLPAFDLVPSPHPDDEDYHRKEGENWWNAQVINNTQLHEMWHQ